MALVQGTEQLRFIFAALNDFIGAEADAKSACKENGVMQPL